MREKQGSTVEDSGYLFVQGCGCVCTDKGEWGDCVGCIGHPAGALQSSLQLPRVFHSDSACLCHCPDLQICGASFLDKKQHVETPLIAFGKEWRYCLEVQSGQAVIVHACVLGHHPDVLQRCSCRCDSAICRACSPWAMHPPRWACSSPPLASPASLALSSPTASRPPGLCPLLQGCLNPICIP